MKVLLINGSPHRDGNTHCALAEVAKALENEGVETVEEWIGTQAVQGCIGCYKCMELGRCVFHDGLYERLLNLLPEIDGLVIGSPTYYAGPNGSLCALLDRLFYSGGKHLKYKPGASVAVARRGGASDNVRPSEQVFHHPFHAGCVFPILEYGLWPRAGRGAAGRRRDADNAHSRAERTLASEEDITSGPLCPEAEMPLVRTNFIK